MKRIQIVGFLGEKQAVARNAAGQKFFVPKDMRDNIQVGDWAIAVTEHFEKTQQIDPATGELEVDADGKPLYNGPAVDRPSLTMHGTFEEVTAAFSEDAIALIAEKELLPTLAKNLFSNKRVAAPANIEA